MKRKIIMLMTLLFTTFFYVVNAQEYRQMMNDPNANFYDIQKSFYKYWDEKQKLKELEAINNAGQVTKKREGEYYQFKRWEWFMAPRVYPTGKMINPAAKAFEEWQRENTQGNANKFSSYNGAWSPVGPYNYTLGTSGYAGGIGRVNCIAFDPSNSSIIYAGCPAGGIWKTTTGGNNWTALSDGIPVIGVSGIAVNPTNANQIYILTGDGDGSNTASIGVLRSDNGGSTWNATNFVFASTSFVRGYKLLIDPINPAIQFAATSNGVYRTTNSWTSNSLVVAGDFTDIEFKPGDHNTMYACNRTQFYLSTNNGATFGLITSGLPAGACDRICIGVTAANAAYVYLVYGGGGGTGFIGLYQSTNSGTSFTVKSTTPNLLGYATDGTDFDSQAYYDLTIGVDPANAATVYVGGIGLWKSTNSGVNWTCKTAWYEPNTFAYNHCDQHAFEFNGSTIYTGSDGGIYSSTDAANSFTQLSNTLQNTQVYRIEGTPQNSNLYLYGTQDNGTNLFNSSANTNVHVYGADGGQSRIDYTNSNNVYCETQGGGLLKSTNGGTNWSNFVPPGATGGSWITPFIMSPVEPQTLYAGYSNIYKTTNAGGSWTNVLTGAGTQEAMAIGYNNTQVVYSASTNVLRKTINGGTNWTNITGTLPVGSASITRVACSTIDANKVWVTFSGYSAGNKVFYSNNGGSSWINISGTLPNIPVNCIAFQPGSPNDGIYVGTDLGIYYRDNDLGSWIAYKNGLPNTLVFDFYILTDQNKITAGTFGRGVWVSDLYSYCPINLTLNAGNNPGSGGYQRYTCSGNITATRVYTGGAGVDVKYNAGSSITFATDFNFQSTSGAAFTGYISGCPTPLANAMPLSGTYEGTGIPWATVKEANQNNQEKANKLKAEDAGSVNVYPNPATNILNVTFNFPVAKIKSIEITNSYGQLMCSREASVLNGISRNTDGSRTLTIPINNFSNGIYFVEFRGDGIREMKKFSVAK